jgi:vacuolar-type H+-ATPase subunit I/STV1
MTKEHETVNIFFKNDDVKNEVLKGASAHEKYIILQNQTLQEEQRDLSSQVKELETRVKELEEENETYDESKRYTRALLKNLVELERYKSKISDISQNINKNTTTKFEEYTKTQLRYFRFLQAFLAVVLAVVYNINMFDVLQLCFLGIFIAIPVGFTEFFFYNLTLYKSNEDLKTIEEIESKIKQINQNEDFLHKYIECV